MFQVAVIAFVGKAIAAILKSRLQEAHTILDPALRELSVALVNDRAMAKLHFQFMGIDRTTDVLTFPLEHDRRHRTTVGEVVVCVPEARRQAKRHGTSVQNEVLLYALHGMLHLCGFDDRTPRGYRKMHETEDEILTQLGIGPVFDSDRAERKSTKGRKS